MCAIGVERKPNTTKFWYLKQYNICCFLVTPSVSIKDDQSSHLKTRNQRKKKFFLALWNFLADRQSQPIDASVAYRYAGWHFRVKTNTGLHLEAKDRLVIASGNWQTSTHPLSKFFHLPFSQLKKVDKGKKRFSKPHWHFRPNMG